MKIFNWVQRRFHHKDGFGRYVNNKKAGCIENEGETQALLKNVVLGDVINGWSEGILTIGTFGFDPKAEHPFIKEEQYYEDECNYDDNYDDSANEGGELNPLVLKNDKIESNGDDENGEQGDVMMTADGIVFCPYDKMKKGERVTLADLFSADSDMNKTGKPEEIRKVRPDSIKKPDPNSKDGLSFAKKQLIHLVGEDSHPIQKIQRLMTKMKKRKIHPDVEGKLVKKESTTTTATSTTPSVLACFKTQNGANESVSLLQTQDGILCA